jgi:hypothetical protein
LHYLRKRWNVQFFDHIVDEIGFIRLHIKLEEMSGRGVEKIGIKLHGRKMFT